MTVLNRVLFNVLCKDLGDSTSFYKQLFGLVERASSSISATRVPQAAPRRS